MDDDWSQSTVVVAGAGRGQGATEAARFAGLGASVLETNADAEAAETTAASIGPQARGARLDVSLAGPMRDAGVPLTGDGDVLAGSGPW